MALATSKSLYIIRHGQAMHNPRAELAHANGCSNEEFFELMRQDDALDADLTPLGREQAKSVQIPDNHSIDLVVSSPLSRALETADLGHPMSQRRVCCESFREIWGDMLCAKRRTKTELEQKFPAWNFQDLQAEHDHLWSPQMEDAQDAAERGYQGLCWLMDRPEDSILLVCHGGILNYMMNQHPLIALKDERTSRDKAVESRFDNCEVRRYTLSWNEEDNNDDDVQEPSRKDTAINGNRRAVFLTQVDR
jgi:broad specificity phosphatase PhoE